MLAALVSLVAIFGAAVYNVRRMYTHIDDEPAGNVTAWIIGFPMVVVAVLALIVVYFVQFYQKGYAPDYVLGRMAACGVAILFVPVVVGIVLAVMRDLRNNRNQELHQRPGGADNEPG